MSAIIGMLHAKAAWEDHALDVELGRKIPEARERDIVRSNPHQSALFFADHKRCFSQELEVLLNRWRFPLDYIVNTIY